MEFQLIFRIFVIMKRILLFITLILSMNLYSQTMASAGLYYSSEKMLGLNIAFGNKFIYGAGVSENIENFSNPEPVFSNSTVYQSTTFVRLALGVNFFNSIMIMGTFGMGVGEKRLVRNGSYYYGENLHTPHFGIIIQQKIYRGFGLLGIYNKVDGVGIGLFYSVKK